MHEVDVLLKCRQLQTVRASSLVLQACVKEMLKASDEELASMLGGNQAGPQPMHALLQALGRPERVVRRSAHA